MTVEETATVWVSLCHHAELVRVTEDGGMTTNFYCPVCGKRCGFFLDGGTLDLDELRDEADAT